MEEMIKLIWTMAFMLRDLSKYGAVDISKLPEIERAKFGVMFSLLDKQCHEAEEGSNK